MTQPTFAMLSQTKDPAILSAIVHAITGPKGPKGRAKKPYWCQYCNISVPFSRAYYHVDVECPHRRQQGHKKTQLERKTGMKRLTPRDIYSMWLKSQQLDIDSSFREGAD